MNWNVNIQATVSTPANYLVAAIYDHSAPTVVVQAIPLPKPYGSSIQITFTGVEAILYDFKLFESVDTSPAGTIRSSFVFQPTTETTLVRQDLYLVADISTNFTSGTNSYVADTPNDLTGWNYGLERVGVGTLQPGADYIKDANGWHLANEGDIIAPQEKFVLHFLPIVKQSQVTPAAVNLISATRIITGNATLDFSDMTKGILIQGAGSSLTITLPLLSTVADNKLLMFFSAGGNHINAVIACAGSDTFQFVGGTPNSIPLAQNEQLWIFKANGIWNVAYASDTIRMTGEVVYNYSKSSILPAVFANGALLSRTSYSRLWKYVQSLESGVVLPDANWNDSITYNGRTVYVNRGKFTLGDGSTTFRIPIIYSVGNLKAVDGSGRLPGAFEGDQVGVFTGTVTVPSGNSFNGSPGSGYTPRAGRGAANPDSFNIETTFNSGNENKQANIGIYALIRI